MFFRISQSSSHICPARPHRKVVSGCGCIHKHTQTYTICPICPICPCVIRSLGFGLFYMGAALCANHKRCAYSFTFPILWPRPTCSRVTYLLHSHLGPVLSGGNETEVVLATVTGLFGRVGGWAVQIGSRNLHRPLRFLQCMIQTLGCCLHVPLLSHVVFSTQMTDARGRAP
jgi:hypothetical protein